MNESQLPRTDTCVAAAPPTARAVMTCATHRRCAARQASHALLPALLQAPVLAGACVDFYHVRRDASGGTRPGEPAHMPACLWDSKLARQSEGASHFLNRLPVTVPRLLQPGWDDVEANRYRSHSGPALQR